MNDKVCVITGANSGIGKETATGLAKLGGTIVMICRNQKKGAKAREDIIRKTGNPSVDLLPCDLESMSNVRPLAETILNRYESVNVLVNNAGIFSLRSKRTAEGFERTFAVNYFAPFLLTHLLLDRLKKSSPSRVVNVSSVSHFGGHLDLEELEKKGGASAFKAYSNSKLALVMFTYELAKRIKDTGVTVNCLHPGAVSTSIWRIPSALTRPFMLSAKNGAKTSIYLSSSPEVEGESGQYYEKMKPKRSSDASYDEEKARRLWDLSLRLVGLAS